MYMARDVLGLNLHSMEEDKDPIPNPTPLRDVKVKENERAVLIDVWMPPVRERVITVYHCQ